MGDDIMENHRSWEKLEAQAKATSSTEKGLDAGLCGRCSNSTRYRRKGQMNVIVRCSYMEREVPTDIEECSGFASPTELSLYEMQKIALHVDNRKGIDDKAYL